MTVDAPSGGSTPSAEALDRVRRGPKPGGPDAAQGDTPPSTGSATGGSSQPTGFSPLAVPSGGDGPSLEEAARANRAPAGEDAAASSAPEGDEPAIDPTSDGRSDLELRDGEHVGNRAKRVEELKAREAELEGDAANIREERRQISTDRDRIESRIDEIEDELEDSENSVGDDVLDVVTSPLKLLGGGGVADDISDRLLGMQDERNELDAARDRLRDRERALEDRAVALAATQAELATERQELENEIALRAITSSMHAVGADSAQVDVMDGVTRDIRVVADDSPEGREMGGDAAYDYETDTTLVKQSYIDTLDEPIAALQAEGTLDGDGAVVDAVAFDASRDGDQLLAAGALIAVHEEVHAGQDEALQLDSDRAAMRANVADAQSTAARFGGEDVDAIIADAYLENEIYQVASQEIPAYSPQIAAYDVWGVQRTVNRVDLTHDAAGNPLPAEVAAARIFNYRYTGQPGDLEAQMAGRSGHVVLADPSAAAAGSPNEDPEGRRIIPGEATPEGRRIIPGEATPEGRRIIPGEDLFNSSVDLLGNNGTAPVISDAQAGAEYVHNGFAGQSIDDVAQLVRPLLAPEAIDAFLASISTPSDNPEGRRIIPGEATPEGRRIIPGEATPEGRRIIPGEATPEGRRIIPGEDIAGVGSGADIEAMFGLSLLQWF